MSDETRSPSIMVLDASRTARAVARDIARLAGAFSATGNDRLADELDRMADALNQAAEDAQTGVGRMIHDASSAVTVAAGNMLAAAVAGHIQLGSKSARAGEPTP